MNTKDDKPALNYATIALPFHQVGRRYCDLYESKRCFLNISSVTSGAIVTRIDYQILSIEDPLCVKQTAINDGWVYMVVDR